MGIKSALYVEATSPSWVHRTRLKEAIKRRVMPSADGIVTQGPDGANYAKHYGAAPERIHYVRFGFPLHLWDAARQSGLASRNTLRTRLGLVGTTFVYVGRLWWGKGLEYLLEAFSMVETNYKGQVTLLVIGRGPDEQSLRRKVRDLGCEGVIFAGFVSDTTKLAELYSAADVFVFPSLGDPYATVLDEAMACRLPIITTSAVGDVQLRVQEGNNGFIVPPRDSLGLADRMERFTKRRDMVARMGERSRDLIDTRTLERWATEFETAMHQIASNGSGAD
jgi:glycosyltransferase involved in cell wall biosynthesis